MPASIFDDRFTLLQLLGGALNPLCPTIFQLPCDWEAVPHKAPVLHTDTYALRGRPVGQHSPMIGVLHTRNLYDEEACGVGRLTSLRFSRLRFCENVRAGLAHLFGMV